ncbi:5-methylcytosine rRNA methyltransferase NSUN4 isoform X1 [Leguminivora glycinivorella]|uniref:5-methylcytosine rRNA methyltransferase NSUN4 isoform X1 n=1 Tax=Leguminivora glycinivorella TaxID=1035111 RepID=UPI00200CAE9E|nr:5-methylcytosine rRNA methyltransferase NSUN4 isoform X1 [Leguminivora glycinivorella]
MLSVINICKNVHIHTLLVQQIRFKSKTHWAKLRKKTSPKYKAQNHFDEFYGSVFGGKWPPMKEAMLRRSKYVAVVNNYGDAEETIAFLTERGAHCLRALMSVQEEFHKQFPPTPTHTDTQAASVEQFTAKVQSDDISSIYPQDNLPEKLELSDMTIRSSEEEKEVEKQTVKSQTLEESLASAQMDMSRIIDPSMGVTSEALYQYVPATQLKGMDEWVPESLHYSYYSKDTDFPLAIEPETEFSFPEHLKVYTYEMGSEWNMFPEPKRCKTNVLNYYPMDCGSVLAVLALCLSPGDRVLDLCSAPGGKALVALQTLLPDVIVCNDSSISRTNRIGRIFRDYLIDFDTSNSWRERVLISTRDGRDFTDDQGFDKVLVDVPCTTDRHTMNEDENNIFRPDRIKERLRMPEMQSQLLTNALKLVRVGGAVVYSTCSLSPVQNDGVVHMALKHAFETHGIIATVKDLSAPFASLAGTLSLAAGSIAPRYGQLVTPTNDANFGPSYITRLVRVK